MAVDLPNDNPAAATESAEDTAATTHNATSNQPGDDADSARFRIPWPVQLVIMLLLGGALGGFIVHKHDNAKVPIAVINGFVIDKNAFEREMESAGGAGTLRQMAIEELQLQYARKLDVLPSQKEVLGRYQELLSTPGAGTILGNSGQTEPEILRRLMVAMAQERVATKGIVVTDAEVRSFYQANADPRNPKALFYQPPIVSLSIIETKSATKIRQAIDALEISKQPFGIVAHEYSDDPSKYQDGQIPPVEQGRTNLTKIPGLEHTLFAMRIGQTYGPAQFNGTWWIIQCNDKSPATLTPFANVRDDCVDGAAMAKVTRTRQAQIQAGFEAFQKSAKTFALLPQYSTAVAFGK